MSLKTRLQELDNGLANASSQFPIVGEEGINVRPTGNGTAISLNGGPEGRLLPVPGRITTAPPGKSEYTDERYWVQLDRNDVTADNASDAGALSLSADLQGTSPRIVTAHNLDEYSTHGHSLKVGVEVTLLRIDSDRLTDRVQGKIRWIIVGGENIGHKQGQAHVMLADNSAGWGPICAVPVW